VRRQVETALNESLADTYAPELREMIMGYLARPARYIRPRLVIAAARAYGATEFGTDAPVVRLAVATELLHIFALLHDDRIDTSCRDGEFSRETALLAGDLLYTVGYGLIAETVASSQLPREILLQVRHVASRTVVGQAADVTFRRTHSDRPQLTDLYRLYDMKTGLYTMAAPLQIGALAAGSPPSEISALHAVALPLGRAFQMRDDLRDMASAQDVLQGTIPPWELNLAVTHAAERARQGGSEPEPIGDATMFLADSDTHELARFVDDRIGELVDEATRAVDQLSLPVDRRVDFRRELEATLTSLTFPPEGANTEPRSYGTQ